MAEAVAMRLIAKLTELKAFMTVQYLVVNQMLKSTIEDTKE